MVYLVSFLTGAALMGLEMVGSRVLAPAFGSSIFVWGSLIGVVLTALSLGYYAGGYLSDRYPRFSPLSALIALSGAWIALTPSMAKAVLPLLTSSLSGELGPLAASSGLFFVPSALLAMVSPWCMRLLIRSVEGAGHSAGLLYAVSNAGSIVGTFATTFILIPRIGTDAILTLMACLLLVLAAITALISRPRGRETWLLMACLVLVVAAVALPKGQKEPGLVYETESLYHHIYVVDRDGVRVLRFDQAPQSGMYLKRPYDSAYRYPDYFHLALTMNDHIEDVLMIGLGAGMAPKRFQRDYPDMRIEVVEIDAEVVKVARKYFGFPEDDKVRVYVQDGRMFLKNTDKKYDLIVVDAYYADAIPFHLATVEFYELVKQHLKPGGVLASNMIGALAGPRSKLFSSMYVTMSRVFPTPYVFVVQNDPGTLSAYRNIEVFAVLPEPGAAGSPRLSLRDFQSRAEALAATRVSVQGFVDLVRDLYEGPIDKEGAVLLTDDHAPVDSLLHLY